MNKNYIEIVCKWCGGVDGYVQECLACNRHHKWASAVQIEKLDCWEAIKAARSGDFKGLMKHTGSVDSIRGNVDE